MIFTKAYIYLLIKLCRLIEFDIMQYSKKFRKNYILFCSNIWQWITFHFYMYS